MRAFLRLVFAHVLATFLLQLILTIWVLLAGPHINPIKALIAMTFAPILIPVQLLRIGPRTQGIGYAFLWVLYLATLLVAYLLLRWRRSRKQLRAR